MMKLNMVIVAGAMTALLAGCGGAPSTSDFEAKLREYNKKIEVPMPDGMVKASVAAYEKASNENRQKMYDDIVEKAKKIEK